MILSKMKHIDSIENKDHLQALVRQDLREIGVKIPKAKRGKGKQNVKNQVDLDWLQNYLK